MSEVMITLNQIKAHDLCCDGWAKVLKANGGTKADMDKPFPVSSILESNDLDDTLWVLRCLPDLDGLWRKFAAWSASEVAHLMKDERSVSAVITSWDFAEGEADQDELAAAWDAAWAADWDAQKAKLKEILDSGEWVGESPKAKLQARLKWLQS